MNRNKNEDWQEACDISYKVNMYFFKMFLGILYLISILSVIIFLLVKRNSLQTPTFVYYQLGFLLADLVIFCMDSYWEYERNGPNKEISASLDNAKLFCSFISHWIFVSVYLKVAL